MSLSTRFQTVSKIYQGCQAELQEAVDARQRLDAQLQENQMVKKEFSMLAEENTIYKMIGPVLVQQDQSEAKANVETRLEFISSELKRIEASIKDIEAKSNTAKAELVEIQNSIQQQQKLASKAEPKAIPA